jgi:hypothetical protein
MKPSPEADLPLDERVARAMAESVRDPEWSHYLKPARAAIEVVLADQSSKAEAAP